ncbi:MAG: Nre family DNA repair protein [Thermosphaera aggregans]|uniref:Nre family DNA repair protein n=1 Tax=Thermosphaera aggregans TaxID=54254 RepID=UPI003C1145A1
MRLDPNLCILCRGRGFCGLSHCPVLSRTRAQVKLKKVESSKVIEGSSPPAVFVGRYGYPYVRIGASTPPLMGDTSLYDYPEKWLGLKIDDVLDFRWSLITGFTVNQVRAVDNPLVENVRLMVMSVKPVDVYIEVSKPPRPVITFDEHLPPMGPRSPLEKVKIIGNPSIPKPIDSVVSDHDLEAEKAVLKLYFDGVPVSHIQKIFSIGALGVRGQRRLVPTRWSITAVDCIISRNLLKSVKKYEVLGEIQVFEHRIHGNLFLAILYPEKWSYEWMEAWWPGSAWNPLSSSVVVEGDYEDYKGRDTYPGIGGCYYASMLATLEYLNRVKKQATAILLREIYPSFNIPIGVWFVRESVRAMFSKPPVLKTTSLKEVGSYLDTATKLGALKWFSSSRLIQRIISERKITDFFEKG